MTKRDALAWASSKRQNDPNTLLGCARLYSKRNCYCNSSLPPQNSGVFTAAPRENALALPWLTGPSWGNLLGFAICSRCERMESGETQLLLLSPCSPKNLILNVSFMLRQNLLCKNSLRANKYTNSERVLEKNTLLPLNDESFNTFNALALHLHYCSFSQCLP